MDTGTPSTSASLPQDEPVLQTFNHVQKAFPSETSAVDVVIKGKDVTAPAVQHGIEELDRVAGQNKALFPGEGYDMEVSKDKTVATLTVEIAGDGTTEESNQALDAMRQDVVPPTIGSVAGVDTYVGGGTAQDRDFNDPIKAIVLNLLSVAASFGAMVLVFQHGWFKSLLGFSETGPITSWVPLFMFVVLFGLSMDYHVFILSRVREAYDNGMKTEDAVPYAIKNTAGVVTSAAIVMVAVFAVFGSLSFIVFKQMGVGLAVAVLLDATLIRGVLLPATMQLLGDRNWWLPKALHWLPQRRHEGEVE